jgi:hypothetical protein
VNRLSKPHEVKRAHADGETFIFRYTDQYRCECLRQLGRLAADPASSFTWYDAAVLSQEIRKHASV